MLVGDLLVLISFLCWVYKIVPTPNVQHHSSMIFIIHPDFPSVHLLLLNHPAFLLPELLGLSWCSLVPGVWLSIFLPLISHLPLLIYASLVCLIHNDMFQPLLTVHFSGFFLRLDWWVQFNVDREKKEQKILLYYELCIKPELKTRLHIRRKTIG